MKQQLEQQSTRDLLKTLRDDATLLVVQHIDLARAETVKFIDDHIDTVKKDLVAAKQDISSAVMRTLRNTAYLYVGSMTFYTGFIFLLVALALGINSALEPAPLSLYAWAGPLIVGIVTALSGFLMMRKAKKSFEEDSTSVTARPLLSTHMKEKQQWMPSKQIPGPV